MLRRLNNSVLLTVARNLLVTYLDINSIFI